MKLHIITLGKPKLSYAKLGWEEYIVRLSRFHQVQATHISDKHNNAQAFISAAGSSWKVALALQGQQLSSESLAHFLDARATNGHSLSFYIGGPDGLPDEVIKSADTQWSLSQLTFPHDLAMVLVLEALYRASSINASLPYHK